MSLQWMLLLHSHLMMKPPYEQVSYSVYLVFQPELLPIVFFGVLHYIDNRPTRIDQFLWFFKLQCNLFIYFLFIFIYSFNKTYKYFISLNCSILKILTKFYITQQLFRYLQCFWHNINCNLNNLIISYTRTLVVATTIILSKAATERPKKLLFQLHKKLALHWNKPDWFSLSLSLSLIFFFLILFVVLYI